MRRMRCHPDGGRPLVVLLLSGGLLDGDEVSIEVTSRPGARLALAYPGGDPDPRRALGSDPDRTGW